MAWGVALTPGIFLDQNAYGCPHEVLPQAGRAYPEILNVAAHAAAASPATHKSTITQRPRLFNTCTSCFYLLLYRSFQTANLNPFWRDTSRSPLLPTRTAQHAAWQDEQQRPRPAALAPAGQRGDPHLQDGAEQVDPDGRAAGLQGRRSLHRALSAGLLNMKRKGTIKPDMASPTPVKPVRGGACKGGRGVGAGANGRVRADSTPK